MLWEECPVCLPDLAHAAVPTCQEKKGAEGNWALRKVLYNNMEGSLPLVMGLLETKRNERKAAQPQNFELILWAAQCCGTLHAPCANSWL